MVEFSEYLAKLMVEAEDAGKRYLNKIAVINVDPFTFQKEDLNSKIGALPLIEDMEITDYFEAHNCITEKTPVCDKLEAYKYYQADFVKTMGSKRLPNGFVVVVGKVSLIIIIRYLLENGGMCAISLMSLSP